MIIVKVELWSALTHKTTELARMTICNDGLASTDNPNFGDYQVATMKGRDFVSLDKAMRRETHTRSGVVKHHARKAKHVWNLVGKALGAMGYDVA